MQLDYVFERRNGKKLLDVASRIYGERVFIGDYPVEHTPVFYEMIDPFLTDEDRAVLYTIPAELGLISTR